jgi:hypothetical protein
MSKGIDWRSVAAAIRASVHTVAAEQAGRPHHPVNQSRPSAVGHSAQPQGPRFVAFAGGRRFTNRAAFAEYLAAQEQPGGAPFARTSRPADPARSRAELEALIAHAERVTRQCLSRGDKQ